MNKLITELERECSCVSKHVPLPHVLYEVVTRTGVKHVCPTTYYNLQSLVKEYRIYEGRPPGRVRKHYSDFVQNLVLEAEGV